MFSATGPWNLPSPPCRASECFPSEDDDLLPCLITTPSLHHPAEGKLLLSKEDFRETDAISSTDVRLPLTNCVRIETGVFLQDN